MKNFKTIHDLESQTPNYSKFHANPEVCYIFNSILLNENNLIKMYDYTLAGKPALEAVVHEIETYFDNLQRPTFNIATNSHARTYIGRAIAIILEPLGLQKFTSTRLSKSLNSKYFSSSSIYKLTENATFKVVKHIEEI